MPGKLCFGGVFNNAGAGHLSASKAFCEGLAHRAQGTASAFPVTDNPHAAGSEDNTSWAVGWITTNGAAGGHVSKADAPCCSVPQGVILA